MDWETDTVRSYRTPDFLTSITSVTERRVRPEFEDKVPKTPEEFALYFRNSSHFERLQKEIELYKVRDFVRTWRAWVTLTMVSAFN